MINAFIELFETYIGTLKQDNGRLVFTSVNDLVDHWGKHYRNGYGVSASDIVGFQIPRVLQERIKEQWKEFQRTWSHAEAHVIRKGRREID